MKTPEQRSYLRAESVVFRKTTEPFGGLSNMAGGYPLCVNGVQILTAEALYQACRFPHRPEVQRLIIAQRSPMTAKMKSKPFRNDSRPDWEAVRIRVMRWCLRVKLAQNWAKFADVLLTTRSKMIVEESYRDMFWGAKPAGPELLIGANVLGRLLMELRELLQSDSASLQIVPAPNIPQFRLFDRAIEGVYAITPPTHALASKGIDISEGMPTLSTQASLSLDS